MARKQKNGPARPQPARKICGLIMPISAIDNCSEAHWSDVRDIVSEAIDAAGFDSHMVSDADDVGIIQKRIIENVYANPVVVCDVSGKNPNVMFELGMRLAFDKPTVIIKDDKTAYSFDTSPIEHLEYPRDLRFSRIVDFKDQLTEKIKGTFKKATEDANYTTFLKHFGSFTVAKLDTKSVSKEEYLLEEIRNLRRLVLTRLPAMAGRSGPIASEPTLCLHGVSEGKFESTVVNKLVRIVKGEIRSRRLSKDHWHVTFVGEGEMPWTEILSVGRSAARSARLLGLE